MSEGYTRFTNNLLQILYQHDNGLTPNETRAYLCIIRFTLGWKRKTASLSNSFLANACNMDKSNMHKAISGLESKGWITMQRNGSKTHDITVSRHTDIKQALRPKNVVPCTVEEHGTAYHETVVRLTPKIERNKRGDQADIFLPPEVQEKIPIPDDSFHELTHEEEMDLFIADPDAFARIKKEKPSPCAEEEGQNAFPKWMI